MKKLTNPEISVIIPTHNSEMMIKKCISSLISQSYPREKFEIIAVYDGSIDKTLTIAKESGCTLMSWVMVSEHIPEDTIRV